MSYPKKDDPVVGVGGSVHGWAKVRIYAEAEKKGISPSRLIGEVLERYAEELPEWKDPNQEELPLV